MSRRPEGASGGGLVLVVDDQQTTGRCSSAGCSARAIGWCSAEGGLEGLELARSRPVDVILLDILMPDLSGYEVLARLKANDALKQSRC